MKHALFLTFIGLFIVLLTSGSYITFSDNGFYFYCPIYAIICSLILLLCIFIQLFMMLTSFITKRVISKTKNCLIEQVYIRSKKDMPLCPDDKLRRALKSLFDDNDSEDYEQLQKQYNTSKQNGD